ncbi:MAG: TauD/TfdA family dioxygenase [Polymorphobacter sp.]
MGPIEGRPYALVTPGSESTVAALDPSAILALFEANGALLMRGFGVDLPGLRSFTDQFCCGSVFNESPDRQLLDAEHNIQSVNAGTASFPLHPELSREPWKPDVCFFACLVPPRALGATTVCDGVALASELPAPVRDGLAGRRLRYRWAAPPEVLDFWLGTPEPTDAQLAAPPVHCPYEFARIGDQPVRMFTRPALHAPMFSDQPAFGNFLLFSYFYNRVRGFPTFDDGTVVPDEWLEAIKATGDALTAEITWQKGDLLMLDNSRFLHGRTAVVPDDDRMIASYFGYLKDAPVNPEEPADPPWRRGAFRPPQRRIVD